MIDGQELNRLIESLALPPGLPWLVTVIALLMSAWLRKRGGASRRSRHWQLLAGLGVIGSWAFSTHAVSSMLLAPLEADFADLDRPPPDAKAIVVLGGGAFRPRGADARGERLTRISIERLVGAARLARASGLPLLVAGGAAPSQHETSEAELMRRVLEDDLGIPVKWVEDRSRNTAQNARFAAQLLRQAGLDHVVLVTSAVHMKRAIAWFEREGLRIVAAPIGRLAGRRDRLGAWLPSADGAYECWLALHERVGFLLIR